jgi:hypothetical protein
MTSAGRPVNWPKSETTEFGQPINFRGLRHAPINEQGVVFLFGMVSYELGFIVEAVMPPTLIARRSAVLIAAEIGGSEFALSSSFGAGTFWRMAMTRNTAM